MKARNDLLIGLLTKDLEASDETLAQACEEASIPRHGPKDYAWARKQARKALGLQPIRKGRKKKKPEPRHESRQEKEFKDALLDGAKNRKFSLVSDRPTTNGIEENPEPPPSTQETLTHEELADQVKQYLAKGGSIEHLTEPKPEPIDLLRPFNTPGTPEFPGALVTGATREQASSIVEIDHTPNLRARDRYLKQIIREFKSLKQDLEGMPEDIWVARRCAERRFAMAKGSHPLTPSIKKVARQMGLI